MPSVALGMHETRASRFFRWTVESRVAILAAAGLVVLVAALGARRVRVDFSVEQFFLPHGPEREAFDAYRQSFPKEDTRFTLFWQDTRPLGALVYRDMARAVDVFERVGLEEIRWLGNVTVAEPGTEDESLSFDPLLRADVGDSVNAARLAYHRHDPLLRGFLWDSAQSVFAIHGYLDQGRNNDPERRAVEAALREGLEALHVQEAELVLGGLPVARVRAPTLLAQDLIVLAAGAVLLSGLILLYFLRNAVQVGLLLASVTPAYFCTIGLMGFLGKPISVLTSFIPVVVLVVGLSDAVHLVTEFRRRVTSGTTVRDAVVDAFQVLGSPCLYTSLTTAVGFASLAATGIGIVVDFGVFTALAILLTFVFTMTVLPSLLSLTGERVFDDRGLASPAVRRVVAAAERLAARRSVARPLLFGVIGVGGLILGMKLRVNTLLIDDIRPNTEIMRDIRWIEDRGFGLFQLAIHLRQAGDRPLHHPEVIEWIEEFRTVLEREPVVLGTYAFNDLLGPLRGSLVGREESQPLSVDEAAQFLLLVEMQEPDLLRTLYVAPRGEAQLIVTVRDAGSVVLEPFLRRVDEYLATHSVPGATAVATGTVTMIQSFTARLLASLVPSLMLAMALVAVCMARMFRSTRLGVLAVIPNVFPLLVLLGAMQLGGFDLKPSTILVFSIAFGIAVDNTIHLLGRFLEAVAQVPTRPETALQSAMRAAGPGITMNTIVVLAGFAPLLASHFQVLYLIGLMTVLSALAALAANLFAFPVLLDVAWRTSSSRLPVGRAAEGVS